MDATSYAKRRKNLRRLMHDRGLGALLVTLDANRFYLSGFEQLDHQINESSGCVLVLADGNDWLCTDMRYYDAAKRLWDPSRIFIYGGNAAKDLNELIKDKANGVIGFDDNTMTVSFYNNFSDGLNLDAANGLVEELRMIKDSEEIAMMEASAALNHKLMDWLPGTLAIGKTEEEIAWSVESFFRENGAESLAFPCITAIGPNAALPHAVPGKAVLTENSCVLVDVGCRLNDYCSDQTRTFWVGDKPTDEFMNSLSLVRIAQEKAISAIRPWKVCSEIYAIARNYLDENKVGHAFTHGLGHGIGLQTHEAPSLNSRNDTVLRPGMIITVEPGLYYPQWGGVRWEYMVLVTEDGCRIL